jgi:hypothetical protein
MDSPMSRRPNARHRLCLDDLPELATLAQTAEVMGLSVAQVRGLIHAGRLAYVPVTRSRLFVPKGAIARFIAENTVHPCREETPGLASASSKSEVAFTSAGPKVAAAGSAARVRQIAKKLKSHLPSSSTNEPAMQAHVIPLKC